MPSLLGLAHLDVSGVLYRSTIYREATVSRSPQKTWAAASIVLVGLAVPQLCRAQALPLGRWTGSAGSMDHPALYPLTFDVTAAGDSLRILLHSTPGEDY